MTVAAKHDVLLANMSVSNNTSTQLNTGESREEMGNHNDSVSCLDEELLSVLINLQNLQPDT